LLSNFAVDLSTPFEIPKKYTHFAQNGHKQIKRLKTASVLGGQREMVQVLWLTIQPGEFKLLVEEWRMVESLTGNENLEIQWRLATLSEAKAVVSHYHKHLSENEVCAGPLAA
jgi:hypothetical protein